ncbi:disease resistance protein RPM1-like [Ananas comosus]|uniref:Disease resistance protein RPM1-like n=1 Tax=Ananas comosus TaxID=4615 RepID=A0A6P5FKR0_ANACO|nr:disease resistance protein RPM1-like [Ananas comosus]
MAEAVVSLLLHNIGAALASEATKAATSQLRTRISTMKELMKDISEIKDELESMLSFLRIAERLKEKDESTKIFIKQTRDLAFDIEDIIDEFTYKLGEEQGGVLPRAIKRCRNIKTWDDLSSKLKEIKINLQNIMERRTRYDTRGMESEAKPLIAVGGSKSRAELAHFVEEDDIVGIDKYRDLLLKWLKDEDEQQRQPMIISVLGMGGLGMTTLVTHVYKIIKATFDACAWVAVSQSYETDDLLRRILKEFYREDREKRQAPNNIDTMDKRSLVEKREVPDNIDTMDCRSLVETIHTYLHCKNYVLILDDVWSIDVLDNIKNALLNSNSKSRIVLTTRIHDVALLANENHMFELKPLEIDDSWDLFCKNAFWKSANKICPPPLEQCAKKIVEKCGGLPLAIVSIACLLSFREQTSSEWEKVYKDLEWYLTNNESKLHGKVHDILKLSLDDLPHYLRNCFLYCSNFPEDYQIRHNKLIRLWVAEGFIEERGITMEEVAEDYLSELVHRCLLQEAEWNEIGRVCAYRMHDIIRVLALSESKELSFCIVYEHSRTILQGYKARRLSILSNIPNYRTEDKSHLRSVLVFNNSMSYDLLKSVLRSSKFLRVLELQGTLIEKLPSEICNLFNLHYLCLRDPKIKELPRSIGKLRNLQILDTFGSEIEKLPKGITELQKLRHLFLSDNLGKNIKGPVGIWRLKGLQSLATISATRKIVRNVEALTELRTFGIKSVRTHHCADLWNSITKMNHLSDLLIWSEDGQELQQLGTLRLPLPIQELDLEGKLDKNSLPELATSFGSLTNLTILRLSYAKLDEDTFPYLQELPSLMFLELYEAYDGMKLHFQATSFPKLKTLVIAFTPKLSQVEIERGAMASLNMLDLKCCPELKELPHGIEYLTTLQHLCINRPAEELIELLRGGGGGGGEGDHSNDWRTRVRHIPNFTIGFIRDRKYVEERIQ